MEVNYAVLCDHAIAAPNAKSSIIGIFQQVNVDKLPFTLPTFYLAFELAFASVERGQEYEALIRIDDADGGSLATLGAKLRVPHADARGEPYRLAQAIGIHGLVFTKLGGHQVSILVNGEVRKQISVDVVRAKAPEQPDLPET